MRLASRFLLAQVLAACCCFASVSVAQRAASNSPKASFSAEESDARAEAGRRFGAGVSLQQVDDFEAAVAEYEASIRLYPTHSARFNLANCLRALHRYHDALEQLEGIEAMENLPADLQRAIEHQRPELEGLVGYLQLRVSGASSDAVTVRVDRRTRKLTGPSVRMSVGSHQLLITAPGFQPWEQEVQLLSQQTLPLDVSLQPLSPKLPVKLGAESSPEKSPSAALMPRPTPDVPAVSPKQTTFADQLPWIFIASGGGLMGGGLVAGGWALALDSELESECEAGACPEERAEDIQALERLVTTSDILLGVGGALGLGGAALLFFAQQQEDSATQLGLLFSPGLVGLQAEGQF